MKKTRILAALLCVIMVVCSLPMMQASATVPSSVYSAVGTVLGGTSAIPHPGDSNWGPMAFDFTDNFDPEAVDGNLSVGDGITFSNTDGAVFPEANATLLYNRADYQSKWTALAHGNWGVRFQLGADGYINLQTSQCWGSVGRAYIDITEDSIKVYEGTRRTCGDRTSSGLHCRQ